MATKKQKRQEGVERHARRMEELRITGLEAQKKDREMREARAARAKEDAERRERKMNQKITTKTAVSKIKPQVSSDG